MIDIKSIYYDIGNAVKGICDKTYAKNRPKSIDETVGSYIVVFMPSVIRNTEISDGGEYNAYATTVQIEIYVRDKASASNANGFVLKDMDEKIKKVLKVFPIVTDNIVVTHPQITMQDDDGDGFSVTIIQGRLRTK